MCEMNNMKKESITNELTLSYYIYTKKYDTKLFTKKHDILSKDGNF